MVLKLVELCLFLTIVVALEPQRNCPESNGDQPELIPDKYDCTVFYICDSGQAFKQNCSAGLYFNPLLNVCDRPENVVFCEYDDFVYLKPHCSCSKYVICNFGVPEVRDCVQGYHFTNATIRPFSSSNPCSLGSC